MKTNSELKNRAIDALTGNWGLGAVITLVYGLVMNAPTLPYRIMESVASSSFSLIALLLLPLGFGYTVLFLDVIRGIKLDFARLFDGFKDYGRILGTMLLTTVYTFLWTLLLVIPGIMKSYSYAMTLFILKDYPELQYNAAIEKSMAMMSGHKMKMFLLDLSFIGWAILCCFPFVISSILCISTLSLLCLRWLNNIPMPSSTHTITCILVPPHTFIFLHSFSISHYYPCSVFPSL